MSWRRPSRVMRVRDSWLLTTHKQKYVEMVFWNTKQWHFSPTPMPRELQIKFQRLFQMNKEPECQSGSHLSQHIRLKLPGLHNLPCDWQSSATPAVSPHSRATPHCLKIGLQDASIRIRIIPSFPKLGFHTVAHSHLGSPLACHRNLFTRA